MKLDAAPIGKTFVNMASLTPAVIMSGQALNDMGNGGDRTNDAGPRQPLD